MCTQLQNPTWLSQLPLQSPLPDIYSTLSQKKSNHYKIVRNKKTPQVQQKDFIWIVTPLQTTFYRFKARSIDLYRDKGTWKTLPYFAFWMPGKIQKSGVR